MDSFEIKVGWIPTPIHVLVRPKQSLIFNLLINTLLKPPENCTINLPGKYNTPN